MDRKGKIIKFDDRKGPAAEHIQRNKDKERAYWCVRTYLLHGFTLGPEWFASPEQMQYHSIEDWLRRDQRWAQGVTVADELPHYTISTLNQQFGQDVLAGIRGVIQEYSPQVRIEKNPISMRNAEMQHRIYVPTSEQSHVPFVDINIINYDSPRAWVCRLSYGMVDTSLPPNVSYLRRP